MLDGKQLRKLFIQFNREYFESRLPMYKCRVVNHITNLGETGKCFRRRRLIKILRGLPDGEAKSTLLHEMAHAATSRGHDNQWKAEMIRLRNAGAPFIAPDVNVTMEDWSGNYVSRRHFSGVVSDALIDFPDLTLSQAIRHFIRSRGGAATIKAFIHRYPWVRHVFRECKREHVAQRAAFRERIAAAKTAEKKSNADAD